MVTQKDYSITVSTSEFANTVRSENIKRDLINALPWLSDFCKDDEVMKVNKLTEQTEAIIKYFDNVLREEERDIHDYAGCKLGKVNSYTTEVIFNKYRFE